MWEKRDKDKEKGFSVNRVLPVLLCNMSQSFVLRVRKEGYD